jgi:hypothetical protein
MAFSDWNFYQSGMGGYDVFVGCGMPVQVQEIAFPGVGLSGDIHGA